MGRISALTELTTLANDDYLLVLDSSANIAKKITVGNAFGIPDFGWTAAGETWTFSSYSSTTKLGVVTVPSDATTKYNKGMRIKITQSTGGIKYGEIYSVTSTSLSIFFDTYTLNNETISTPSYSSLYAPLGMPDTMVDPRRRATSAYIATNQGRSAGSGYGDLATVGPEVTVNVGPSGVLQVTVTSLHYVSTSGDAFNAFALSGANTRSPADSEASMNSQGSGVGASATTILTGLTPGATTVTSKYKAVTSQGNFLYRMISAVPL